MANGHTLKAKANAAYAAGDYCAASDLYTWALEGDCKSAVLLSNRSAAFAGIEDFRAALQDATACVEADPNFVKGYSRQGFAYAALKPPGPAEKAYRNGLSKDPRNAGLRQGLAAILKEDGDQSTLSDHHGTSMPFNDIISDERHIAYRSHKVYKPILEFWLDKRARPDAKDVYGQTALQYAVRITPMLPLAAILLKWGADVNMQCRTATPALMNCVAAEEEQSVRQLLKWGADPFLKDSDGVNSVMLAERCRTDMSTIIRRHQASCPAAQGSHDKAQELHSAPQNPNGATQGVHGGAQELHGEGQGVQGEGHSVHDEAEEQYLHKCASCGAMAARRRCNRCRLVVYCSPDCQKAHWKSHKASCTRLAQQHLRVNVSLSSGKKGDGGSSNSVLDLGKAHHADNLRGIPVSRGAPVREVEPCINVRHNKLFSVKIQVPQENHRKTLPELVANFSMEPERLDYSHLSKSNDPILCYDEDRQFCCYILRKQNDSEKLARLIQEKGFVGGGKAYFKAYIDQTTNHLVVVPTLLPAQPW